jgi:pilus assembly protein CpaB
MWLPDQDMEVIMRRGRIFFYLAFILILGLAAAAVIWFRFLQPAAVPAQVEAAPTPVVELVKVVVVTQHIPRGSKFDETVLGMVDLPRDVLIDAYFTDMGNVVGRQASTDLEANMLLTSSMVVDSTEQLSETGSLAALSIPRGLVAVSIPISRLSSVSYAPRPGDHVNVITTLLMVDMDSDFQSITPNQTSGIIPAGPGVIIGTEVESEGGDKISTLVDENLTKITAQNASGGPASPFGRTVLDPLLDQTFYAVPSERQRPRLVSQTLLQDVVVLGLGNFATEEEEEQRAAEQVSANANVVSPDGAPAEGENPQEFETGEPTPEPKLTLPDVITLIVTPQDAVTLNYLIYTGAQLTLALRPSGDDTRVQVEAATLDFLLKQYNIPVPARLPYGVEPRVDELVPPSLPNDAIPTPEP